MLLHLHIISGRVSIQNRQKIPRTLMRNGKCSIHDLSSWRSSQECLTQVEKASASARSYSLWSASRSQSNSRPCDNSTLIPLPSAQSIASSMITADLNSLKTRVDDFQSRFNTLEKFSYPSTVIQELDLMKSLVDDIANKPTSLTTSTQTVECASSVVHHPTLADQRMCHLHPVLRIAAWNCRGLSSGLPYCELLVESHDIIIISEHWLWPFELHKIQNIHPNMTGTATADNRLNPECSLTRGCGGVGIIWNERLKATPVVGINLDRICAITIDCATTSIPVISVYLPSTDHPTEDFHQCLHILEDLVNKHCGPVILAGDFNSHVGSEGGPKASGSQNLHGRLLLEMVCYNDLFITFLSSLSTGPSYTYFREDTQTILTTSSWMLSMLLWQWTVRYTITIHLTPLTIFHFH